ncbi:PAS domain S-box protein [Gigaspora margarita]|uniref:PAS domain S-box protein n=1 Tax=Gigaspora margarita TaxID=4874 RepID=A0A8H4AKU0_GIGMA|nr:PAS domain S-box protein [Gigaspora margarita]
MGYFSQECCAWKQLLKRKHSHVIGKPSKEIFPEAYEIFVSGYERYNPQFQPIPHYPQNPFQNKIHLLYLNLIFQLDICSVRITGKGTFKTDQLLELQRDGYTEETYFSYAYNPIFKSDGSVCAIFILAQETTQNVLNIRRLKTLDELSRRISEVESLENACHVITKVLNDNNADIPYALIYFIEHKLNTAFGSLIARLIATTFDYDNEKGWVFPDYIPETPEIIDLVKDNNKCYNTYPELDHGGATCSFLECGSWPMQYLKKEGDHIKVLLKDGSLAYFY